MPELEQAIEGAQTNYSLEETEFLPVIPNPQKIICIGINYRSWMAIRGEIADNAELHLVTRLNGTEMQRATSHQMIFSIPELIEYCSKAAELEPGGALSQTHAFGVHEAGQHDRSRDQ